MRRVVYYGKDYWDEIVDRKTERKGGMEVLIEFSVSIACLQEKGNKSPVTIEISFLHQGWSLQILG
jgi:hypothetical protein